MSFDSPLALTFGARNSAYLTTVDEFRKYRKNINRQLVALRHDLDIITKDTANYRQKEKTSAISAELYNADPRNGLLLLLTAERDVVRALEIKSMLEISGDKVSSYKKVMASRLKRAVATCKKLLNVTSAEQDATKRLELYVYAALVNGLHTINKLKWREALYTFSVARCGLELLASKTADEEFLTVSEILDSLVDPSLALAVNQDASTESSADIRTVARKMCHDHSLSYLKPAVEHIASIDGSFLEPLAQEEISKTVQWRSHEATLSNDELAFKLNTLTKYDWTGARAAVDFDSVYSKWSALVDIHSGDVEKNRYDDDPEKQQNDAILTTYFKYNMYFAKVKRDALAVLAKTGAAKDGSLKSVHTNKDVLRLVGLIVSTIDELKDLPGVYNDDDLTEALDALRQYYVALQALVMAQTYTVASKHAEALKILLHVDTTFQPAPTFYKLDFPYSVSTNSDVKELRENISLALARTHTLAQLYHESWAAGTTDVSRNVKKFPLLLDSATITKAGEFGALEPVLPKAVLFDVAFNYIGYSNGVPMQHAEPRSAAGPTTQSASGLSEAEEKKKGGFFGLFGRS